MKPALVATLSGFLAVAATAAADPAKLDGHTLDFARPAKWMADEKPGQALWVGQYTSADPAQQITVKTIPHKLADGPSDLAVELPKVDKQMDALGLKPNNDASKVEAGGFAAMAHHYAAKDGKTSLWGMAAVVDAGTFSIVITATAKAQPNDLTKATLDLLGSLKVDGKKGPAIYPAKK